MWQLVGCAEHGPQPGHFLVVALSSETDAASIEASKCLQLWPRTTGKVRGCLSGKRGIERTIARKAVKVQQ